MKAAARRTCIVEKDFRDDLVWWVEQNRKTATRVLELMEHVMRDPFQGIGKPEPLKYLVANTWSRRLTQEHRLVYVVEVDRITFVQCRYHY